MIARQDFIDAVRSCVGTPAVHMGRHPGKALDCVGLPWAACWMCGLELSNTRTYDSTPSEADLTAGLSQFCDREMDPARAHIWQVLYGRQARHVVVPVGVNECGQPLVVHVLPKMREVRETVWQGIIYCGWRIRGVA